MALLVHIFTLAHWHLCNKVVRVGNIALTINVHHASKEFWSGQILLIPLNYAMTISHLHLCYLWSPVFTHHINIIVASNSLLPYLVCIGDSKLTVAILLR